MTEDEAKAVAAVAAQCLAWSAWRRWEPVMRYGRLFTPGPGPGVGDGGMFPEQAGRASYRQAVHAGLLYAEGYAGYPRAEGVSWPWPWAWCLDGDTVVDPAATRPGNAYFGVALRPEYLRRVHEAQILPAARGDGGGQSFRWAFTRGDQEIPPLNPATDLALDFGRDIPSAVREWALTAERHPGPPRTPPDWVLAELLGGAPGPVGRIQFHDWWAPVPRDEESFPAVPGPYARYQVCLFAWFNSGIALRCGVPAGGADPGNGHIVGMIQDGDSVATLLRMADEHRRQCEGDSPVTPEPAAEPAWTPAEARLQTAGRTFAVLRRLEQHTWDAWLRPAGAASDRRVTRNCVSYEMAFAAVFRALGGDMPAEFTTVYAREQPGIAPPSPSRLPLSYERYLIRSTYDSQGMALQESGSTAGVNGREGARLADIPDGTTLSALIEAADKHWPADGGWTWCSARERANPELTVQQNAEVDLCWQMGGEAYFAALHRFVDGTWDAWVTPSRADDYHGRGEEPTELLTPAGVSYEVALAAVFRAMGDHLPTGFGLNYLDRRITPGLPGPAQV